jgi:Cu2+-exporting ATPase
MTHKYKISGMTCNGCRSTVEKALQRVEGVSNVEVNLQDEQAVIEMKQHVPVTKLKQALEETKGSYSIALPCEDEGSSQTNMTHTYDVHGMTCNGCRSHVEKTLNEVEGVTKALVNLEKEEAVIEMDKHIPLITFQKKLEEDGGTYSITVPGEKPKKTV